MAAEIKCVINDVKTGKSYQKALAGDAFSGKKLGDKVDGKILGLNGYELEISGGSDDAGFPMRKDVQGTLRKKALLAGGVGVTIDRPGMRKRKSVRGNTFSANTAQVNLKIVKYGAQPLDKALGLVAEEAPKEEAVAAAE